MQYKNNSAVIAPEYGMNTIELSLCGKSVLRSPRNDNEFIHDPIVYGIAALMPPNRTENGSFTFNKRQYILPINEPARHNHIHGFLNRSPFSIYSQSDNEIRAFYINEKEIFPWKFRCEIQFSLNESAYHQQYSFQNIDEEPMPITFGLHSNFAEPNVCRIPIGKRWEVNQFFIPTGRLLELTSEEQTYKTGFSPSGMALSAFYTAEKNISYLDNLKFTVSDNFDQWIIWNAGGNKNFISVEPQCGAVNCLNSHIGLRTLLPGETIVFTTDLAIQAESV